MLYFHGSELIGVIWHFFDFGLRSGFDLGILYALAAALFSCDPESQSLNVDFGLFLGVSIDYDTWQ